jgi:hypothetical protein
MAGAMMMPPVVFLVACNSPFQPSKVTVEMTWACGSPEHMDSSSEFAHQNPAAKPVTLYFSRYPNEIILDNTPGLCDALTVAKHTEVPVVIQPIANLFGKYTGYTVLTIDGHTPDGRYGGANDRIGNDANPSLEELLR